jgi:PilZ domain
LNFHSQFGTGTSRELVDARRHRRFKLETEIRIYPRNKLVARGYAVDLSEAGVSAMLKEEIPLGEVVRLEFTLPHGDVEVLALVRQRNAFRYGFQFVESASAQDLIGRSCRQLAVEQRIQNP